MPNTGNGRVQRWQFLEPRDNDRREEDLPGVHPMLLVRKTFVDPSNLPEVMPLSETSMTVIVGTTTKFPVGEYLQVASRESQHNCLLSL